MKKGKILIGLGVAAIAAIGAYYALKKEKENEKLRKELENEDEEDSDDVYDEDIASDFDKKEDTKEECDDFLTKEQELMRNKMEDEEAPI